MDSNWFDDMIPAYLAGTLSDTERKAFEEELTRNPKLQQRLADTRFLKAGIDLLESLDADHPAAEILVRYAETPSGLDDRTRAELEAHLGSCTECRQDVEMTRRSLGLADETKVVVERSTLSRLQGWLSARLSAPVLAASVTALLVIAVIAGYQLADERVPEIAVIRLTDSVERGTRDANVVMVSPASQLVRFQLVLPTVEDALYSVSLIDSSGRTVLTLPNQPHALPMDFVVPTMYLHPGTCRIRVIEQVTKALPGQQPDSFDLGVTIELTE